MSQKGRRSRRDICSKCGSNMRYVGKNQPHEHRHHESKFYCTHCDRHELRG